MRGLFAVGFLVNVAVWTAVVIVAVHFIAKVW